MYNCAYPDDVYDDDDVDDDDDMYAVNMDADNYYEMDDDD